MDLMTIDDEYLIYFCDEQIHFGSKKLIGKRETTEIVWMTVIEFWYFVFTVVFFHNNRR